MSFKYVKNKKIRSNIYKGAQAGLTACGIAMENETVGILNKVVYNQTPKYYKLTGKLKQSYNYVVKKLNMRFGTNLSYAPHVEYPGVTRNFPGKPHVRPAFDTVSRVAARIIGNEIKKKL